MNPKSTAGLLNRTWLGHLWHPQAGAGGFNRGCTTHLLDRLPTARTHHLRTSSGSPDHHQASLPHTRLSCRRAPDRGIRAFKPRLTHCDIISRCRSRDQLQEDATAHSGFEQVRAHCKLHLVHCASEPGTKLQLELEHAPRWNIHWRNTQATLLSRCDLHRHDRTGHGGRDIRRTSIYRSHSLQPDWRRLSRFNFDRASTERFWGSNEQLLRL